MDLKCSIIHKHFFFLFATVLLSIPKFSATENCWRRCENGQEKKKSHPFLSAFLEDSLPPQHLQSQRQWLGRLVWGTTPACLCCMWICIWEGTFRGSPERLVLNMATGNPRVSELCHCEIHCLRTLKCLFCIISCLSYSPKPHLTIRDGKDFYWRWDISSLIK